jgi:hypothetical protein
MAEQHQDTPDPLPPGAVWLFRAKDLGSPIPLPIRLRALLKRLLRALDFQLLELPIPEAARSPRPPNLAPLEQDPAPKTSPAEVLAKAHRKGRRFNSHGESSG